MTAVGSVIQNTEANLPYLEAKNGKNYRIISIRVIDDASILDFKVANGIVRVKTVPSNTMTIEGNCRVAAQDERVLRCRRIVRDRVKVGVDDDKIVIKSVSKRV